MLNFECITDKDRREAAAIDRRRALEEERKKRIFNPKARISLDYKALDEQIRQKKKLLLEEKQRDIQFEELQRQFGEISESLAKKEKDERKKLAREINEFRLNFQKSEDRREFDLNDPKAYKSIPARLYDDDPRCGPSSIQRFQGEDLYSKERSAIQKEQFKAWLDQQMEEKEAAEKERIQAENAYKAALMARDERALQLETLEKDCRKRLDKSCSTYNKALADERKMIEMQKKKEDERDSLAHKYNVMMSDIMTENVDSQSNLGPNRQQTSVFKGITNQQRAEIMAAQLAQIEQVKTRKIQEERFNKEWDEYFNGVQKTMAAMDQEMNRKQREVQKQIAEENERLKIQQKNKQEYLNKVVYSNKATEEFFGQFNKSGR